MNQPMFASNINNLTSTNDITTDDAYLHGFYVNSTSSGTVVFREGGSSGTVLNGTITPAVGWHWFPKYCKGGVHVTIGGTLNASFFFSTIGS